MRNVRGKGRGLAIEDGDSEGCGLGEGGRDVDEALVGGASEEEIGITKGCDIRAFYYYIYQFYDIKKGKLVRYGLGGSGGDYFFPGVAGVEPDVAVVGFQGFYEA